MKANASSLDMLALRLGLSRPLGAALYMRPRALQLLRAAPRRAHSLAASSVTVRAAAAAAAAEQAPASFGQLGVSAELQVGPLGVMGAWDGYD